MSNKQTPTRMEALQKVAEYFGTQQAMADHFRVSQPTVWRWLHQSKRMPAEYVLSAEAATGVSRHYLRPDIYPIVSAAMPASAVGEEVPLCMPILSARILGKHGNRSTNSPKSGRAA